MNTVSNLLVFTCSHTSCCCSRRCSVQTCQQPHFRRDKSSQTIFFLLLFGPSQAGVGYLQRHGQLSRSPAVPCRKDGLAGPSSLGTCCREVPVPWQPGSCHLTISYCIPPTERGIPPVMDLVLVTCLPHSTGISTGEQGRSLMLSSNFAAEIALLVAEAQI